MERSEAIEIVREYYPSSGKDLNEALETLIPELKESEDERIRNNIIYIVKFYSEQYKEDNSDCIDWLEKQGEQTPADKVEPKFHEGEWLCENEPNNYARFIQILETVNVQGKERYRISRDIHNNEDVVEFDFVEKYYHKFDIKDAKDGDVLSNEEMIVIFKRFEEPSYRLRIVEYIGLDTCGNIQITDDTWTLCIDKAKPATKEQRDLLFQKMKEAGYEWDAEKKELKKIEQSPAWSEEDEKNFTIASVFIKNTSLKNIDEVKASLISWLKSLKDRVQPHSTWKPSDKQIDDLEYIMTYYPNIRGMVNSIYTDLKKLKG